MKLFFLKILVIAHWYTATNIQLQCVFIEGSDVYFHWYTYMFKQIRKSLLFMKP